MITYETERQPARVSEILRVMKFYFCESCGKRITDEQIATGDARDKKLKGVFCKDCAFGVTTMETLPMDDAEAKKTLEEEAKKKTERAAPPGDAPRSSGRRTTSARNIKAVPRKSARRHSSAKIKSPSESSSQRLAVPAKSLSVLAVGIGCGVMAMVLAVLFWAMSGSEPPPKARTSKSNGDQRSIASDGDAKTDSTDVLTSDGSGGSGETASAPSTTEGVEPDAEQRAQQAYDQLVAFAELKPDDTAGKLERVKAYLAEHGGTAAAAMAQVLHDKLSEDLAAPADQAKPGDTAATDGKSNAPPKGAAPETAESKKATDDTQAEAKKAAEEAERQARIALTDLLQSVVENLSAGDLARARESVNGEKKAPEAQVTSLGAILATMARDREAFLDALRGLVGKKVTFETRTAKIRGTIEEVHPDSVVVSRRYVVNGQERDGGKVRAKIADLTEKTRAKIYSPKAPANEDNRARKALECIVAGDADVAEAALDSCKGHILEPALRAQFKRTLAAGREAKAMAAWLAIEKDADRKLGLNAAKRILERLDQFEKDFGKTSFATESEQPKYRKELRDRLHRLSLGLDPRVARLFNGHVKSYDPSTQKIELLYDLSNEFHRKDFSYVPIKQRGDLSGVFHVRNGLELKGKSGINVLLHLPRFFSGDISISVRYTDFRYSWGSYCIGARFYGPGSEGKTSKIAANLSNESAALWGTKAKKKKGVLSKIPKSGTIEFTCKGNAYRVKHDDKVIIEHAAGKANDHRGMSIFTGRDTFFTLTHMQVKARIDPRWLAKALAKKK